jgi:hypothetical protein
VYACQFAERLMLNSIQANDHQRSALSRFSFKTASADAQRTLRN